MAVASIRAVVWEWQRDDGGYSPYFPEVIQIIENAWKSGQTVLNLGTASASLSPYDVDLVRCQQIRPTTGMVRGIRRSEVHISGTPCHGLWEWQDGSNHYNIYNIVAMVEIEEAYSCKQLSVDLSVKPSQLPYTIDFTTMYQTRHYFDTKRKIRRTPLSKPLQSYLNCDTSSLTTPALRTGTTSSVAFSPSFNTLGIAAHGEPSIALNNYLLPTAAGGSLYNISLPSVIPSMSSSSTTSSSAFSQVTSFDTSHYKSPHLGSLSTPFEPNLHSAVAVTSTCASSSPGKSRKGGSIKKTSTKVVNLTSGSSKNVTRSKSASKNVTSVSNEKTTSKSTKRCRTKVERPTTNGKLEYTKFEKLFM